MHVDETDAFFSVSRRVPETGVSFFEIDRYIRLGLDNTVRSTVYTIPHVPESIHRDGNRLFISTRRDGVMCLDLISKTIVGTVPPPPVESIQAAYHNDHVYQTSKYYEITVHNVSDPTNPIHVASIHHPEGDRWGSSALHNNRLYVKSAYNDLMIFDISDPSVPVMTNTITDPTMKIGGHTVFTGDTMVSSYSGYVTAFDISDPDSPRATGGVYYPEEVVGIGTNVRTVSAAYKQSGLQHFNLTGSGRLIPAGMLTPLDRTSALGVVGEHAFIATPSGPWQLDLSADTCPARSPDLNGDGVVDFGDIQTFIALFLAQDLAVDLNVDGIVDQGDIQSFVSLFLAGC